MNTSTTHPASSCQSEHDAEALPVAQAKQMIKDFIVPIRAVEMVALRSALGRVLGSDIVSPIDVPAHDNSAMDGYALDGASLPADGSVSLTIVGNAYAGQPFTGHVAAGACVRIMTGAVMPAACNTVVPQEVVTVASDSTITIPAAAVKSGDNRRLRGEDLQAGAIALRQGKILRPADIGLLASLGLSEVAVFRRLRAAFFSTGDELRSIGEPLEVGCVYDSNRYTLHGMLTRLGCEVIDLGVVRDEPQALNAAFRSACEQADVILTSGGVSVGAADYTRQIMEQLGDVYFWKLGMRPGRPLAFGNIRSNGKSAYLFGLPGNPVAVMVSFYMLVRDALLHMMGAQVAPLPLLQVAAQSAIRKKPGRTEYLRGIVLVAEDGRLQVALTGTQGSGVLRSMSEANCMIVLPHEKGNVAAGEMVEVLMFEGLL